VKFAGFIFRVSQSCDKIV